MIRREFITLLGGAAMAWSRAAGAQQRPAMPVVGFLSAGSADGWEPMLAGFHQGLKEMGYVAGQNVAVEYHWMEGRFDRAPAMVAELIRRQVAVIFANTPGNLAAKAATTAIPIVFATGGDPVQMGLVASLSRPGGNVTGVTQMNAEVSPKRLGLAHELVPTATTVAILVNPASPIAEPQVTALQAAARTLGLQLHVLHASTERDFDTVFATLAQQRAGPLVISADSFFNSRSKLLGELTLRHAVPAIYEDRAFAAAGGLMTYGGRTPDMYRIAGAYTGRILKGERPADLPVQQGTRVELIINVKTAKVLGLSIPLPLLARADEVIE
jgi:putative ABC transport system substrate-binding protein